MISKLFCCVAKKKKKKIPKLQVWSCHGWCPLPCSCSPAESSRSAQASLQPTCIISAGNANKPHRKGVICHNWRAKGLMWTATQKCAPLSRLLQGAWGTGAPSPSHKGMRRRVGNICPSAHSGGVSGFIGRSTDPHGTHNVAHCACTTTNRLNQ